MLSTTTSRGSPSHLDEQCDLAVFARKIKDPGLGVQPCSTTVAVFRSKLMCGGVGGEGCRLGVCRYVPGRRWNRQVKIKAAYTAVSVSVGRTVCTCLHPVFRFVGGQ